MTIQQFTAGQTLTAAQMNTLQASDFNYTINTQSGTSYTLVASDLGRLIRFTNSGSVTLTVPADSSVLFDVGDRVNLLLDSAGTVNVQGASGVAISAEGSVLQLNTRYSLATLLKLDANSWMLTGVIMNTITDGEVTESKIAANAVTSGKIADGAIVNADINASAAIAHSKLASITAGQVLIGNASNVPTATALSGDVTVSSTGVTAIGSGVIVNADVNASAAIDHSKLANITAGSVLIGNSSNVPTATALSGDVTVNSTGVTAISSGAIVNADINASAAIDKTKISGTAITAADTGTVTSTMIADGTIVNSDINASAAIALSKLSSGTSGQIIVANSSGVPTWVSESGDVTISDTGVTAISSGVIVNADVNAAAAIAYSKLNLSGSITSSDIADGTIVNADISSTAAIEKGKIADLSIDTKTANYSLVLGDKNKVIEMNVGSANTVTVPLNSSHAFPIGSQVTITQYGAGKTQVVAASGVTVRATPGSYLRAQYSTATLIKRGTNEWYLIGDLSLT